MSSVVKKLKRRDVNFDNAANPTEWRNSARRLFQGAELIWKPLAEGIRGADANGTALPSAERSVRADHFAPFFILAGYAVENELKALILERHIAAHGPFADGKAAMKVVPTKHHDLVKLAKKGGVTLTPGSELLLQRLSAYLLWAGRYPVPLDASAVTFERTTRDRDLEDIRNFIGSLR